MHPVEFTLTDDRFYVADSRDEKVLLRTRIQATAGTLTYSCNDGERGTSSWRIVENPATDNTDQGAPDLVVESPSVSDSTLNTGASFTLRATVRNRGAGRSDATTLRYYRSSNSTISSSDTPAGTDAVSGLAASGSSSELINLTAPSSAGTWYYGACVESVSGESDTANNCSSVVRVTVRARIPDLTVSSTVSDNTPMIGDTFVLTATVRNQGTSASTATTLRYYRSEDRTIGTGDTEVGTATVSALSVDETSSGTINLQAPSTEGTFYYGACVVPVSGESDTGNNCSSAVAVFGGGPFPVYDLDISRSVLHAPGFASVGTTITMTVDVTNLGPNASRPAILRFGRTKYLTIPVLNPNETVTYERKTVGSVRLGTATYSVCIIEAPGEENTGNNCASRSVTYN